MLESIQSFMSTPMMIPGVLLGAGFVALYFVAVRLGWIRRNGENGGGMLRHAGRLWILAGGSFGALVALEHQSWIPLDAHFHLVAMTMTHTIMALATAILFWAAIDHILLPWFSIRRWAEKAEEDNDIAAAIVVLGWFVLFAAFLIAFSTIFAGD